ncbi:MAG: ADP/ATP-dependent (S)-NAD(P)H-hydrate dehydratase, partial [Terrimesophilobacter sp.]
GMVRYLGPEVPTNLVLTRRPEAVTADGKVQAWLLGSGMPAGSKPDDVAAQLARAVADGLPLVLDAGALDLAREASSPTVLTPHRGELARLLEVDVGKIAADPRGAAERAAERFTATVLLKGHQSFIVGVGEHLTVTSASTWLATAGTGDSLAGILGALLATHTRQLAEDPAELPRLAATACVIHSLAAERASGGGPFTVLDLNATIPGVFAELLRRYPET